ncbi:DUF4810 domain-containing protein [Desulfocurvibacter africanus]|uniref:Uncharacterized protein n=1 Tax=Desulfocurvibacter africanus subsp. africanus str. Walvis Bay TaxID=690850 RepID=F3YWZ2_DESAF|nr:DUF4810 domain-containing protein [Desulfocurvibacter africanus]EGJ51716.1 hypothetical protein Desaf_3430 [Desulfocurvibacter africanus subsp. africanus str. Walvis Bay]
MSKMKLFFAIILLVVLACGGCANQNRHYYMGEYSSTLYACRKNPTPEEQAKHVQELENIIAKSEQRNLRVPPGIYAELGYIHLKAGEMAEARNYFEAENRLYPESKVFTTNLLAWAEDTLGKPKEKEAPAVKGVITPVDAIVENPGLSAGEGVAYE